MKPSAQQPATKQQGFTLIEVLVALVILSAMALMSYRGLGAVLTAREQVSAETEKWQSLSSFLTRFERDIYMAMPSALHGQSEDKLAPQLSFNRFASSEGVDAPRRIAYRLNENREIELWIWSGLDNTPELLPARYPVLRGVSAFELHYMTADRLWVDHWSAPENDKKILRAVRMRIALVTGETIMRIISLTP